MHVHFLDPFHARQSVVHQADPRVKLVLTLAFILTCALLPAGAWAEYLLLLALVWSLGILSTLGISFLLKRALLAVPFVLAALPLLFTVNGPPLLSSHIGSVPVVITQPGWIRFSSLAVKSWLSIQAALLLTATTSFPDLLVALRAIKMPRLLVAIAGLMWRYLFILVDEAGRLIRARESRSAQAEIPGMHTGGSWSWRARVTGGMAGSLFLRGYERSDRVYLAMLARGYDGEPRSLPLPHLLHSQRRLLYIGLAALLLITLLGILD